MLHDKREAQRWIDITLQGLAEGEFDDHPVIRPLLRRARAKSLAVVALLSLDVASCAHPTALSVPGQQPSTVTIADGLPVAPSANGGPAPVSNQKPAPCDPDIELEAGGYCWVESPKKPCAPGKTREYQGRCLLPVAKPQRQPTSVGP
jgi:hypothetical protein